MWHAVLCCPLLTWRPLLAGWPVMLLLLLQVVKLLMFLPSGFPSFLHEHGVVVPLMELLACQAERVAVERTG